MIEVFFYGLFMDEALLRSKDVQPVSMKPASAAGHALRIGQRATLVREDHKVVHGMVATLTAREVELLYSEPGLAAYVPQTMVVQLSDGERRTVQCFVLADPPSSSERSPKYASELRALAERLNLPREYVVTIE